MKRDLRLLADLDVPFMPRFSLYCYNGDGDGPGGSGDDVDVVSDTNPDATAAEVDAATADAVAAAEAADAAAAVNYGAMWGQIGKASGPFGAVTPETVEPPSGMGLTDPNTSQEDIANAMGSAGEISAPQGLALGAAKAGVVDEKGNLSPFSVISPAMSLIASAANAPHGSLGIHGLDDPSDPDPSGEGEATGGPSEEELAELAAQEKAREEAFQETLVTPTPEVVDAASSDAVPETSAGAEAPTVSPSQATSAPGTLLRRRRRTRTILTSPQGVGGLGGEGSAFRGNRRTRSLPRQTLLGG